MFGNFGVLQWFFYKFIFHLQTWSPFSKYSWCYIFLYLSCLRSLAYFLLFSDLINISIFLNYSLLRRSVQQIFTYLKVVDTNKEFVLCLLGYKELNKIKTSHLFVYLFVIKIKLLLSCDNCNILYLSSYFKIVSKYQ